MSDEKSLTCDCDPEKKYPRGFVMKSRVNATPLAFGLLETGCSRSRIQMDGYPAASRRRQRHPF